MRAGDAYRWTRPETILAATDLSDLDHLMPFALEQAADTGARLILLHVLTAAAAFGADETGMPRYDLAAAYDVSEQTMHPWCEAARRREIHCDTLIREGHPTQQIAAAVRQFHADRLLLGTKSRSKLGKMLLGSVAEQVLRSVYLPVITVGPEAHLPVAKGEERVVLHATTLRETSRPSAALACLAAAAKNEKLVLLHVLPSISQTERKGVPAATDSSAMLDLRILAAQAGGDYCSSVEPVVARGNAAIEILALADERRANLIVLGAAPRSTFDSLAPDRTVYRVLAHARCPVLTLREPDAAPAEPCAVAIGAHGG